MVLVFNICSFDMLKVIMEEVEVNNVFVILEIYLDEIEYFGDNFVVIVREYVYKSKVLVVIYMDYGGIIKDVMWVIRNGYIFVMIDVLRVSYEENVVLIK